MHIVIALAALGLLLVFLTLVRQTDGAKDVLIKAQEAKDQKLQDQLQEIIGKQTSLEKRLKNVELIVTDEKFTDLPDAKDSIDLKQEMDQLKILIKDLAKK
ncbi:MAG: hypothetical protein GY810_03115 [Aureispira sp.]|nr:hypothetical protein [Aureispira sp.]